MLKSKIMKHLNLTQNKFAIVDEADYSSLLSRCKWYVVKMRSGDYYAIGRDGSRMHRIITNAPVGLDVDHVNGNTLDNRRQNLRVCTHQENCCNRKPNKNCGSKYKGVHWFSRIQKWKAVIRNKGKLHFLGHHNTEFEAAFDYDLKAKEFNRPNRSINFG